MRVSRRELLGIGTVGVLGTAAGLRMRGSMEPASLPLPVPRDAPAGFPPISAESAYLYDSTGQYLYSLDGDKLCTNWASTRKILAGLVLFEEKLGVLDTEMVTMTQADIETTGLEFRSGIDDGEQITWGDVLRLMLVASMSDCASVITRVLGEELRLKYGIGDTAQQAMGYWMGRVAVRAGACNVVALTNTSTHIAPVQDEILPHNMYASPHALAECLDFVIAAPGLLAIMQAPSVSVAVGGSNPRTITHANADRFRCGLDASGAQTGYALDGYVAGKTGDGTFGHQLFACEMPSGDTVYGAIYKSTTRDFRTHDTIRTLLAAENHYPHLRAPEAAPDPHATNVEFRILGGGTPADSGPLGRPITNDGVTNESTEYMTGQAIAFDGASTLTVGGSAPVLGSDDFTLSVFLRGDGTTAGTMVLAAQWRAITGGRGWMLQLDGNAIHFLYSTTGSNQATVDFPIARAFLLNGAPSLIEVVRSGPDLAVLLNGIPSAVHNIGTDVIYNPASSPVMIGGRQGTGSGKERFYTGFMDEVMLTRGVARESVTGYRPRYRPSRWD